MNIIAKHEGQATVASREPQNRHSGASVEVAAPQLGQLSVSACTLRILAGTSLKRRDMDYEVTLEASMGGAALLTLETAGKIHRIEEFPVAGRKARRTDISRQAAYLQKAICRN
jgi:hypothetical protein